MKFKVSSMQNNQYIIEFDTELYFQSYDTLIAKIDKDENITLSNYWDCSRTTMRWLYEFMKKYSKYCYINNKQDILKLIKNGEIKIVKELKYEC